MNPQLQQQQRQRRLQAARNAMQQRRAAMRRVRDAYLHDKYLTNRVGKLVAEVDYSDPVHVDLAEEETNDLIEALAGADGTIEPRDEQVDLLRAYSMHRLQNDPRLLESVRQVAKTVGYLRTLRTLRDDEVNQIFYDLQNDVGGDRTAYQQRLDSVETVIWNHLNTDGADALDIDLSRWDPDRVVRRLALRVIAEDLQRHTTPGGGFDTGALNLEGFTYNADTMAIQNGQTRSATSIRNLVLGVKDRIYATNGNRLPNMGRGPVDAPVVRPPTPDEEGDGDGGLPD